MAISEELQGTVAMVTGASSGIGEAAAVALASRGAAVALVARRRDRLAALAEQIEAGGRRALVIDADVGEPEQAQAAVERTVAELGRLDMLINNAGVMLLGPAVDAPLQEWQRMLSVNVAGLLYCAHAALPHLLKSAEDAGGLFQAPGCVHTRSPQATKGATRWVRRSMRRRSQQAIRRDLHLRPDCYAVGFKRSTRPRSPSSAARAPTWVSFRTSRASGCRLASV